ncbi:MAG: hypothetical protein AAGU27_28655 [Dehalobacterium sp.]
MDNGQFVFFIGLGHAKITTTLDMYVHPSSDNKEEAVNLIDIYRRDNYFI